MPTATKSHAAFSSPLHSASFAFRFFCRRRLLLKARNGRGAVIGLVPAFCQRAGQHQFSSSRRLSSPFAVVQSKQNGRPAFLTPHSEIPFRVHFGPLGNTHELLSKMKRVTEILQLAVVIQRSWPTSILEIKTSEKFHFLPRDVSAKRAII